MIDIEGYIKLYRKLQENPIWNDKPFSKGQAFTDMMFRCNHVCKKVIGYGDYTWVLRGQFISSNYKLADAWGWSESSVRQFIKLLVKEKMITVLSSRHYTLYEVTNYCVYQSLDNAELEEISNAQKTHRKRTGNAQKTPNKNDKNDKNDKKNIFIPPTLDEVKAYCKERNNKIDPEKWFDFYESKNWMIGKNKMSNWKAAVRTWEKSDNIKSTTSKAANKGNFDQRKYTDEDFESLYKV